MDIDAIAAVSMQMSAAETANSVELAMMKKAMEVEQMMALQVLESLNAVVPAMPASFGQRLDVLV